MVSLGPLKKPWRIVRRQIPPWNFITIHYAYFMSVCLLFALIFWGASTPHAATADHGLTVKVRFIDSLFLCVSAMTEAGLNTVNLSELNTFQQVLLFFLIMLGSAIWVSAFVVHVRKTTFEKKLKIVIEARTRQSLRVRGRSKLRRTLSMRQKSQDTPDTLEAGHGDEKEGMAEPGTIPDAKNLDGVGERDTTPPARRGGPEMNDVASADGAIFSDSEDDHPASPRRSPQPGITFAGNTRFGPTSPQQDPTPRKRRSTFFQLNGVGAHPQAGLRPRSPYTTSAIPPVPLQERHPRSHGEIEKYLSTATGWISRNSQFHGLSEKERIKLGGYEYHAVSFLAWFVPVYFVMWQLIGCIGCAAWIALNNPESARTNGLHPWWVGAFNAVSAFNNSGMSLLDANMVAYQRSYYMLITMGLLILAGNTGYPLFLRFFIWCIWKVISTDYFTRGGEQWVERSRTLRFLLDHPRRCYTNLFPSQHSWWLLFSVVALNVVDWAAFEVLNINNQELYNHLPARYRVIDGLFQALAVRSGGFYVVSISTLRISLQVLYVVMMYISVYPVVITMRNSNVYEERSLGIYAEDEEDSDAEEKQTSTTAQNDENTPSSHDPPAPGLLRRALTLGKSHLTNNRESNSHFIQHQLRAQLAHDAWWIVLALFLITIIEASRFRTDPIVFSVFNFIFEIVSAYGCVGISVGVPWASYSFCGTWQTGSKLVLCAVMLRGRHRGLPVAIDKAVLLPGEAGWWAEEEDGLRRSLSRGRM